MCLVLNIAALMRPRMTTAMVEWSNAVPRVFTINGVPRLCLMAIRDIEVGEELLYHYGERWKDIVKSNPWITL